MDPPTRPLDYASRHPEKPVLPAWQRTLAWIFVAVTLALCVVIFFMWLLGRYVA